MKCENCKNENAHRIRFYGGGIQVCDKCGMAGSSHVYDVYWDGKPEENLADGPDGKPITFLSKGQKAAYLRERGLREAGDRVHGAPFSSANVPHGTDSKTEVRETLKRIKEMGRDVRRQEYLKIIKRGRIGG